MSTKIYDAYIMKPCSMKDFQYFIKRLKDMYESYCQTEIISQYGEKIHELTQEMLVKAETSEEVFHKTVVEIAGQMDGKEHTVEEAKELLSHLPICFLAMDFLKDKILKAEKDRTILTDSYDYHASLALFIDRYNNILLLAFGTKFQSFLNKMSLDELFCKEYGFSDFHYQNQTDKPDYISDKEWNRRKKTWDEVLPSGIPSEDGMVMEIIDGDLFTQHVQLKLFKNPEKMIMEAVGTIDSKEKRLKYFAKHNTFDSYFLKQIETLGKNPSEMSYTESLQIWNEFEGLYKQKDDKIMQDIEKEICRLENYMIDFQDESVIKAIRKKSVMEFIDFAEKIIQ